MLHRTASDPIKQATERKRFRKTVFWFSRLDTTISSPFDWSHQWMGLFCHSFSENGSFRRVQDGNWPAKPFSWTCTDWTVWLELLSGVADLVEKVLHIKRFHLGFGVYFSWIWYKWSNVAIIRSWTSSANGDQKLTNRGVTFRRRSYEALTVKLLKMTPFKEAYKIYEDK